MKVIGIIPARYHSSRLPGKPLAVINGKPMIYWVYEQAKRVKELTDVYVATDDQRISDAVCGFGGNTIITSDKHKTGTDRVAEVATMISADWYVNIQGDEPMIEPETIKAVLTPINEGVDAEVINLMSKISDPVDAINPTVPKVITNAAGRGIFLTRSLAPFPKGTSEYSFYKQLGVYAFTPKALEFFLNAEQGKVEVVEEIEILRFIENGINVQYVEVDTKSIAVDTPKDLMKVTRLMGKMM